MNNFFQQLNRELVLAGVWGRAAEMVKQELRDHYLTEKAALLKYGKEENEADRLALSKLGDPCHLAQKARMELDRGDGSLKRQFLLRFLPLGLGLATYLAFFAIATFLYLAFATRYGVPSRIFLNVWVFEVYLVPWLVIFIWIVRASYRPIHGWRSLLVLSSYLALSYFTCAFLINIALPIAIGSEIGNRLLLHRMILISTQSLLLVITPWYVRARRLKQVTQGELTKV